MSYDEVLEKLVPLIRDSFGLEDDQVVGPQDRLFVLLDGDSLGWLDLTFRCERQFAIPMRIQSELPSELDSGGRYTPASLQRLRERFPFVPLGDFERDPRPDRFREMLTVDALAHEILHQLRVKSTAAANGSASI